MMYHATGDAIRKATRTSLIKSFDNNITMFETEAPNTFRTPISFVRCAVANNDKPSKPRQAIKMAKPAKMVNTFPNNWSFAY